MDNLTVTERTVFFKCNDIAHTLLRVSQVLHKRFGGEKLSP